MPTPAQAAEYSMAEIEEWLIANLCADSRCRGDRQYRYSFTRLNMIEASNCTLRLQITGDRRPATIPMADVWQIDIRAPAVDEATIAIRWFADAERDAWYLEDLNNRTDNAGWSARSGSAIFVLDISGPREADDGGGAALMLERYSDLCLDQ